MNLALQIGLGAAFASAWLLVLWARHRRRHNAALADVGWSLAIAGLAVWFACSGARTPRAALAAAMAALWGGRLAWFLLRHRVWNQPEEGRYQALRRRWGIRADRYFFWFFQAQAALALLLACVFLAPARNPAPGLSRLEWAAAGLWLVAWCGEVAADAQLQRFKRHAAAGAVCDTGLWRYSRHPNYFFEWLVWVAYALFGLDSPSGWAGVAAPLAMLFFLLRFTGIPATEAQALRSRGAAYRRYQEVTSGFIPWLPRHTNSI